jgi:hypothetical protein
MIFLFFMKIIVKSRMLFLAVNIIIIGFDPAGEHADWCLTSRFS